MQWPCRRFPRQLVVENLWRLQAESDRVLARDDSEVGSAYFAANEESRHSQGRVHEHLQIEVSTRISTPGPGEIVIDVEATGVNYADVIVRMGLYASAKEYVGWPITPGFEVAGRFGVRSATTSAISSRARRVIAVTRFDGYATQLRVQRHQVFRMPWASTRRARAGFPAVFLTAWYALIELVRLRPGIERAGAFGRRAAWAARWCRSRKRSGATWSAWWAARTKSKRQELTARTR